MMTAGPLDALSVPLRAAIAWLIDPWEFRRNQRAFPLGLLAALGYPVP
jgi:hypothetical protein